MARAHAIWVVLEQVDYEIFAVPAAFTVRHELVTWLQNNVGSDDSNYTIYKTGDGVWQNPGKYSWPLNRHENVTTFTVKEILDDQ